MCDKTNEKNHGKRVHTNTLIPAHNTWWEHHHFTEKDCFKVLQQISASRGAIQSLMSEVLDSHIKEHLGNHVSNEQREEEIENLASLLKTYLK